MNDYNFSAENKEIVFDDRSIIKFDYPIKQHIIIYSTVILRLEIPSKIIFNENVFGVNFEKKKIVWQIEKIKYHSENCPFVNIFLRGNKLFLNNWCGIVLEVNPQTGEVINQKSIKW